MEAEGEASLPFEDFADPHFVALASLVPTTVHSYTLVLLSQVQGQREEEGGENLV